MDTDTRVADDSTLTRYLETVDAVKVEAERFPLLADVIGESFGTPEHRLMVAAHEIQGARLRGADHSVSDALHGAGRLFVATAEWRESNSRKPRKPPKEKQTYHPGCTKSLGFQELQRAHALTKKEK